MILAQLAFHLLPLVYTDTLQWDSDGRKVDLNIQDDSVTQVITEWGLAVTANQHLHVDLSMADVSQGGWLLTISISRKAKRTAWPFWQPQKSPDHFYHTLLVKIEINLPLKARESGKITLWRNMWSGEIVAAIFRKHTNHTKEWEHSILYLRTHFLKFILWFKKVLIVLEVPLGKNCNYKYWKIEKDMSLSWLHPHYKIDNKH